MTAFLYHLYSKLKVANTYVGEKWHTHYEIIVAALRFDSGFVQRLNFMTELLNLRHRVPGAHLHDVGMKQCQHIPTVIPKELSDMIPTGKQCQACFC